MYCFTMICHVLSLICAIVGTAFMIIYYDELIRNVGKVLGLIFVIGVILTFMFLMIFSLKTIITMLKDYNALRNKQYCLVVGKVIGFKRNREPESGVQINDKPVIIAIETNEKIVLNINDRILIGETYKFNYLKNCKIAEIIEQLGKTGDEGEL